MSESKWLLGIAILKRKACGDRLTYEYDTLSELVTL